MIAPPADPEADARIAEAGDAPPDLIEAMNRDLDRIAASQARTLELLLELLELPPMGVLVLEEPGP